MLDHGRHEAVAAVNKIPTTGRARNVGGIGRAQRCKIPSRADSTQVIVQLTTVGAAKCTTIRAATHHWGICHPTWPEDRDNRGCLPAVNVSENVTDSHDPAARGS